MMCIRACFCSKIQRACRVALAGKHLFLLLFACYQQRMGLKEGIES